MGAVQHDARPLPSRIRRGPLPLAALLTALLLPGCRHAAPAAEPAPAPPLEAPLRADWAACELEAFEDWLAGLPPAAGIALDAEALGALRAALDTEELVAVRAALVLARSRDPRGGEALLARLEARVRPAERHADGGDVVATAALAAPLDPADAADPGPRTSRLAALAVGERPHPDLEVRVECAASALARGRDDVVPLLLTVLRDATLAGRADAKDWPPQETLAWCKSRAARALYARLGQSSAFSPDVSYAAQERRVSELAAALRDAGVAVPAGF